MLQSNKKCTALIFDENIVHITCMKYLLFPPKQVLRATIQVLSDFVTNGST